MTESKRPKGFRPGGRLSGVKSLKSQSLLSAAFIPEILTNILSTMETGDLYSTAFVSLTWSELSLNELWKKMDSVLPLLKVLAPMSFNRANETWSYDEGLLQPNWNRFDGYARRIRVLEHCDVGWERVEKIDPSSLLHLLSCLPSNHGPLLPHLKKLQWAGWCDDEFFLQVLPFLSPSIRSLHITPKDALEADKFTCQTIQGLAGRPDIQLTNLNLGFYMDDYHGLPSAIASLLKAQKALKSLTLTSFRVSDPVSEALLGLRELRELRTEVKCSNPIQLGDFFLKLAWFSNLEVLYLVVDTEPDSGSPGPPTTYKAFESFLYASKLSTLRIVHLPEGVTLREEEVAAMGRAWPRMTHLDLSFSTPISSLPTYAAAFPSLHSLTLPITFPQKPVFNLHTATFSSLLKLHIAGEPPENQLPAIAAFLSWVCPASTKISPGFEPMPWKKHWEVILETIKVGHQLQDAAIGRVALNQ